MPVRRTLQLNSPANNTPASKLPVRARSHTPSTASATPHKGKAKVQKREGERPQTDSEKLDWQRSKLEQSADTFIRARKELEEIIPAEGSGEPRATRSKADLKTELKRHRELTSRLESSSLQENGNPKRRTRGIAKAGSSYEFLKSIMG